MSIKRPFHIDKNRNKRAARIGDPVEIIHRPLRIETLSKFIKKTENRDKHNRDNRTGSNFHRGWESPKNRSRQKSKNKKMRYFIEMGKPQPSRRRRCVSARSRKQDDHQQNRPE